MLPQAIPRSAYFIVVAALKMGMGNGRKGKKQQNRGEKLATRHLS